MNVHTAQPKNLFLSKSHGSPVPDGNAEVFLIPHGDAEVLAFSPRKKALLLISAGMAAALRSGDSQARMDLHLALGSDRMVLKRERESLDAEIFAPTTLALALSMDCNLNCLYCHATAGRKNTRAPVDMLDAAIDLYFEASGAADTGIAALSFAGGGEPTLEWDLLQHCVASFEDRAARCGRSPQIAMATNGCFGEDKLAYLVEHFAGVSLSIDGPPGIHNAQRPGRAFDSYEWAVRTGRALAKVGFPFAVRATITDRSLPHLQEIVEHFSKEFPDVRAIGLEPMVELGRGAGSCGLRAPDQEDFAKQWTKAMGERGDLPLASSGGGDFDVVKPLFCSSIAGPDITVTWDGLIAACSRDDPDQLMVYGRFDHRESRFIIDHDAIRRIKGAAIGNRNECRGCFCLYHCAGDCLNLRLRTKTLRCRAVRHTVYSHLCGKLEIEPGEVGSAEDWERVEI